MNDLKIVVIGASAGGLQAVAQLVGKFPAEADAAVFVVLHLSKNSIGQVIVQHLQKTTDLVCKIATDGDTIQKGHLYIGPPDHHILIKEDYKIGINNGPQENRWRPSIDVLFRSAAVQFTNRTIGIVLSGLLDDGTSGMWAIKKSGGICIVQEPSEADFPDMPKNVLHNVDVDYQVPVADMGYILADLLSKPVPNVPAIVPDEVKMEADMTNKLLSSMDNLAKIAEHSVFTCPDCGGGLWKTKNDGVHRYRCHTGHVYTEKVLLQTQSAGIEDSIWVSVRMLEERRNLLLTISRHEEENGNVALERQYRERAEELHVHIERLKMVLQSISLNEPND